MPITLDDPPRINFKYPFENAFTIIKAVKIKSDFFCLMV